MLLPNENKTFPKFSSRRKIGYYSLLICLMAIFIFSIFKNISYPLLWNDEAETAMYAQRILEFGYPKVHDDKNVVFASPVDCGSRPELDAYIFSTWGQYYFAAVGEIFAQHINDIYIKTAILRIPFAVAGCVGILIIMFSGMKLFAQDKKQALIFAIIFLTFEISSVSLALHLKEVRYYSLSILWTAVIMALYLNYWLKVKVRTPGYFCFSLLSLFLLFNSFPPAYFSCIITMGLHFFYQLISRSDIKKGIIGFSPSIFSFFLIIPLLIFHKTFQSSSALSALLQVTTAEKLIIFQKIFSFLSNHEFFGVMIMAKIILGIVYQMANQKNLIPTPVKFWIQTSSFLFIFIITHIILVWRMPLIIIYVRYYIVCQPFISIILILDLFVIEKIFSLLLEKKSAKHIITQILSIFCIFITMIFSWINKTQTLRGHFYELFHQYKGVIDYAVPFIKSISSHPEKLVIATNYEEFSFMYYLNSKVIIGYLKKDLEKDLKKIPDIIIPRKRWRVNFEPIVDHYIRKTTYMEYLFPIYDSPFNNCPELGHFYYQHMFKTKITENEKDMLTILVKQ